MLRVDCRGARRRAGMTQEAWARAVFLSIDRVRALEYQANANLPSLETAYRMAALAGLLTMDGPEGPVGMAPLGLIAHPEAQTVVPMVSIPEEVPGQLSFWGRPVIVHVSGRENGFERASGGFGAGTPRASRRDAAAHDRGAGGKGGQLQFSSLLRVGN